MDGEKWTLAEAIDYYRVQNAAEDQTVLVELLREVQEESGGALPAEAIEEIGRELGLKLTLLEAIVKRYPSLHRQEAPHRLDVCNGKRCRSRDCARLHAFVERHYRVKNGGMSKVGGFVYRRVGCLRNCAKGPNLFWDGQLYEEASEETIQKLAGK